MDYVNGGEWDRLPDMKRYGPSSRHTRRLIRSALRDLRFEALLDVGCGDGRLLREIAEEYSAARLFGLDISETGVRRTREMPGVAAFVWDIEQAPPSLAVDIAVCSEVLEHITDDVRALWNIAACAQMVVITVPSGPLTPDSELAGHLRHYDRTDLRALCEAAGLKVKRLRAWGFPFYDLYRRAIAGSDRGYKTGKYSLGKRIVCHLLYLLFMLNVFDRGDRLVAVAVHD